MCHAALLLCLWVRQEHINSTKSKDDSNELSQKGSLFHLLLFPPSHEYIYHIHPCGFYFRLAWEWVAPNPLNLYIVRNFPELQFCSELWPVSFVQRTFDQPEDFWLCRSGKWICSWPKHSYSSKLQRVWGHAQSLSKGKWFKPNRFFSTTWKSRNLSIPSQSVSVWDRPPATQDLVSQLMMESRSLEYSIEGGK